MIITTETATSTEQGDVILIQTNVPLVGLLALQTVSFAGSPEYTKEYRISTNAGATYSDWKELTDTNISSENITSTETVFLEYRLTHQGENVLSFESVTLTGDFQALPQTPYFNESQFSEYFTPYDLGVVQWAGTVLEKTIKTPDVINRVAINTDSRDFQEYWYSICLFWSYLVQLGRKFESLYSTPALLSEFILQRGYFLSGSENLVELQQIASNIYKEFGKRGTANTTEIERLINRQPLDEFAWCFARSGWIVDYTSPLYDEGLVCRKNAIPDVDSFSTDYTVTGNISCLEKDVITFSNTGSGDGFETQWIPVSQQLDYRVEFEIEMADEMQQVVTVQVQDRKNGNLISSITFAPEPYLVENLKIGHSNAKYYFISHIASPSSFEAKPDSFNQSSQLIMNANTKEIKIKVFSTGTLTQAEISKFSVTAAQKGYSNGSFIGSNGMINAVLKNNSSQYIDQSLYYLLRQHFAPVNTDLEITWLN